MARNHRIVATQPHANPVTSIRPLWQWVGMEALEHNAFEPYAASLQCRFEGSFIGFPAPSFLHIGNNPIRHKSTHRHRPTSVIFLCLSPRRPSDPAEKKKIEVSIVVKKRFLHRSVRKQQSTILPPSSHHIFFGIS